MPVGGGGIGVGTGNGGVRGGVGGDDEGLYGGMDVIDGMDGGELGGISTGDGILLGTGGTDDEGEGDPGEGDWNSDGTVLGNGEGMPDRDDGISDIAEEMLGDAGGSDEGILDITLPGGDLIILDMADGDGLIEAGTLPGEGNDDGTCDPLGRNALLPHTPEGMADRKISDTIPFSGVLLPKVTTIFPGVSPPALMIARSCCDCRKSVS